MVANTDNDDKKMNHLEQLTRGEAHKVVSGFSHPESEWPFFEQDTTIAADDTEVKRAVNTIPTVISESCNGMERLMSRFSDWSKLNGITGWLMTATDNLQRAAKRTWQIKINIQSFETDPLSCERAIERAVAKERNDRLQKATKQIKSARQTLQVLKRSEVTLIRYVQCLHFPEELETLQNVHGGDPGKLKKSSKLYKLDPFVNDGLLRVGGRLERADLPYDAKHPLVLPKESTISKLLMEDAHRSCGHLGRNSILSVIRQFL